MNILKNARRIFSSNGGNSSSSPTTDYIKYAVYDNGETTHTGDSNETYMKGLLIPTLTENSILDIEAIFGRSGTNATIVWKLYYNTTNDLVGAIQIGTYTLTSTQRYARFIRMIGYRNSFLLSYIFKDNVSSLNDLSASTSDPSFVGINLSGYYLVISATITNSADLALLTNFNLVHRRP